MERTGRIVFLLASIFCHSFAYGEQQRPLRRIAMLMVAMEQSSPEIKAFRQGLSDAKYVEGTDVVLDWYTVKGDYSGISVMIDNALATRPDIILAENGTVGRYLMRHTSTIPIVTVLMGDPVGQGLIKSLARPGGNMTGLSMMLDDITAKRLQLLKEAMPGLKRVGVIQDGGIPVHETWVRTLSDAGKILRIKIAVATVNRPADLAPAYADLRKNRVQAIFVLDSGFFSMHSGQILALATKQKLPVIFGSRRWVERGALLSYSASFTGMFRRAAYYVDRVLRGDKPSDLPVEQPTKFELVVNLKTAQKYGLKIPQSIFIQATELIE